MSRVSMPVVTPVKEEPQRALLEAAIEAAGGTDVLITSARVLFARVLGEVRDVVRTEIECHATMTMVDGKPGSNWREVFDDPAWLVLNAGLVQLCCDAEDWLAATGEPAEPAAEWLGDFFRHFRLEEVPSCGV